MERLNIKLDKSPWKDQVFIYIGYAAFSLYTTSPVDMIGCVITLIAVFPILLSLAPLSFLWNRHFGRSKLFTIIKFIFLLLGLWFVTGVVIPRLEPYIGVHFA